MCIFRLTAKAPCLHGQLNSNVRPQITRPSSNRGAPVSPLDAKASCFRQRTLGRTESMASGARHKTVSHMLHCNGYHRSAHVLRRSRHRPQRLQGSEHKRTKGSMLGCVHGAAQSAPPIQQSGAARAAFGGPCYLRGRASEARMAAVPQAHMNSRNSLNSAPRANAQRLRPNPSVELTRSGTAPWPFGGFVYSPPHGQGAVPSRSAHLQR